MGKCAKRAFENGGAISKADQLMAEMAAKYGTTGAAQAAPVQQPAPPPPKAQPVPQPQGITSGIMGILKGRQQQIDKAAGYANGGKVKSYAAGGNISEEEYDSSYNDSAHQAGLATIDLGKSRDEQSKQQLDSIYSSLVGYANGGKIKGPGTPTSDSIPARVKETGEEIRVSNGERIVSAAQGELLEALARKSGFDSLDALLEAGTGKPVGPTIKGGKMAAEGGLYLDNNPDEYANALKNSQSIAPGVLPNTSAVYGEVGKDVGTAMQRGNYANAAGLATRGALATGAALVDDVIGNPLRMVAPAVGGAASGLFGNVNPASVAQNDGKTNPLSNISAASYSNEGRGIASPVTKQNPSSVVDNEFTQGGTNYTVNPTSQGGISRVTAPGKNPLITNIDPQKAVAGLNNQTIEQPADEAAQGIARIANANKIRGEMIANRDKDIPAGGYGPSILADRSVEDNAALDAMRRSSMVSNLSPSQQAEFNMNLARMAQQERGQNLAADTARYTADTQEKRAAGHDQTLATIEANKLAGNPLEQQAKQLDLKQKGIIAGLFDKANAGDKEALAKYNALTSGGKEPNYSNRYVTVQGGEETGPDGTTKIRRPSRVFDAQTGQWVNDNAGSSGVTSVAEIAKARAAGMKDADIIARIKAAGGNPKDYGLQG